LSDPTKQEMPNDYSRKLTMAAGVCGLLAV